MLAPAGNLETAVAAFNAGADAVYLGMSKFNARNRAENFTADALARLLEFAHKNQRKVYITLNTLIVESELPEVMSLLGELSQLDIDAVIVQDLGTIALIRKYFPQMVIHASTQMNIHNSCGIKALEMLGVKRVILERQITIEELKKIAASTSMELEVFVHGSHCISLSGRCLFSNYAENTSGNRGMCRQNCRRNYRKNPDSPIQAYLSPQDLQLLAELPELARLNITSLKIEGRLRGPDYVVPVVEAYRMALDALPGKSPEALDKIKRTVSRPGCRGALYELDKLITPNPQAVFGRNVGIIKSVNASGMLIQLTDRIHLGDKLRAVSSTNASLTGFELTEILVKGNKVSAANAGTLAMLPGRFPFIEDTAFLYKIGENGYDCKRQANTLPPARKKVVMDLLLDENGLHVTVPELPEFEFHSESFAPAERCAVSSEDLKTIFSSGDEEFRGVINSLQINGSWFCAKSVLKNLRRELFIALKPQLQKKASGANRASRAMLKFFHTHKQELPTLPEAPSEPAGMVIPGFIAEGDLENWRRKIREAYAQNTRHFAIGALHGAILLKEALGSLKDITISGVFPLIACNSQAIEVLSKFKISAVMPWVELPQEEVELLRQHSILPLTEAPADCEILVSRVPFKFKKLLDKNAAVYRVEYDPVEKLTKLYGETPALEHFRNNKNF